MKTGVESGVGATEKIHGLFFSVCKPCVTQRLRDTRRKSKGIFLRASGVEARVGANPAFCGQSPIPHCNHDIVITNPVFVISGG
jgi:hypothetical protein